MKRIAKKIIILCFLICFFCINNSFAAPMYYYPEKYSITINNINKEDVKKIEVFTPWGYFNDDNKVEIDGRLFNYNNYYYKGVDGKEYNGVKCKIIDIINEKDIKKTEKGITILLSEIDIAIYLRIYMKNGKEIFTDIIKSTMLADEFSSKDKEYMKRIKEFEEETVYFIGDYNADDSWVKIEITDEQPIIIKSNGNLFIIIAIIVLIVAISIIYILKSRKNEK